MIFDKISNIDNYNLPKSVKIFVKTLNDNIENGKYKIDDDNYANVDIYTTKEHDECFLEAHKKYIDIQILLSGKEQLDYTDISGLKLKDDYDEKRDVMFFYVPDSPINTVQLKKGYFVILGTSEAHRPQMNYDNNSCEVKKVVVKIKA